MPPRRPARPACVRCGGVFAPCPGHGPPPLVMTRLLPVALVYASCLCPARLRAKAKILQTPRRRCGQQLRPARQPCAGPTSWPRNKASIPPWLRQRLGQAQKLEQGASSGDAQHRPQKDHRPQLGRLPQPLYRPGACRPASASGKRTPPRWSAPSKTYGVPPEIIVGIIGVETIYGRNMGNFRVLDALATLAFDYPPNHPAWPSAWPTSRASWRSF